MMDNMDPTPAPEVEVDVKDDIVCTEQETALRFAACKGCDKFYFEDDVTKCAATGCNINLLITYKFKTCPLEKW